MRAIATAVKRSLAWVPVAALIATAIVLAEVVKPWPEGWILVTLVRGRGLTMSDIVVVNFLVVLTLTWLRCLPRWGKRVGQWRGPSASVRDGG